MVDDIVRMARIMQLVVRGVTIETTAEHPFWVLGKGWLPAGELSAGDFLTTHTGEWVRVDAVDPTEVWGQVYNLRVADHHTYFVGCDEWGLSVWAHNEYADFAERLGLQRQDTGAIELYTLGLVNATRAGGEAMFRQAAAAGNFTPEQVTSAWSRVRADGSTRANMTMNLGDALFQHAATAARDNPAYHNRTVETALHVHPDGSITMQSAASGGGHRYAMADFAAIALPTTSLHPLGRPAMACGMPRAVQGVADIIGNSPRSAAPSNGVRYVTEGGIRYHPADRVMTYMAPCHNCSFALGMDANNSIRTLPPPYTVPASLRPNAATPFTPPSHWGWQ